MASGARAAESVIAAAAGCEAVLVSVRDDAATEQVIGQLVAGRVAVPIVNCTTCSPALARTLAERAPTYVSAPVLGTPQAVVDGSATYLVAGPAAVVVASLASL